LAVPIEKNILFELNRSLAIHTFVFLSACIGACPRRPTGSSRARSRCRSQSCGF